MYSFIQTLHNFLACLDPGWALGTAGNSSANIKLRLSGDFWGQAPSCIVGGRGRWVCPWQAWPSQAFLQVWLGEVRCGGPKVRRQWHRDAALGALESQKQTVSKCQYFWTGNKHYANEMQKDANHGHSILVQSYFG